MKIPENLSDEQAATLGVGITTVGQALYQSLGLPLQGRKNHGATLLVYGGSTATGSLAIQFAIRWVHCPLRLPRDQRADFEN